VFALLDYDVFRAVIHDPASGLDQIVAIGQLSDLGVVQHQEVHLPKQLDQLGTPALDPEVHGVGGHQPWSFHLSQNVELKPGVDVREKHERSFAKSVRDLGAEAGEYAEVGLQRFRGVQIVPVPAPPAERVPF
jgi:hypothetical protein